VRLRRALAFLLGVAVQILVPLLVERAAGPPPATRVAYVPQSFAEAAEGLERYQADHGRVPTAEEGLAALVPDYLPAVPVDPWHGVPYRYEPTADGAAAELLSYGDDGRPGGTGAAADLSLLALSMGPPTPPPDPTRQRLVNLSFLLTPLAAFLAATRWTLAGAALSGCTVFTGILLTWAATTRLGVASALALPLLTSVACIALGYAAFRGRRLALALLCIAAAWLQLTALA
jgi:general secretion pathway protein G